MDCFKCGRAIEENQRELKDGNGQIRHTFCAPKKRVPKATAADKRKLKKTRHNQKKG